MNYEVHCPNCGEFQVAELKRPKNKCPRCGSPQVITLHKRWDIRDRFKTERETRQLDRIHGRGSE